MKQNINVAKSQSDLTGLIEPLNGKKDAFRHAFFQAINIRDVPSRRFPFYVSREYIVRAFSNAHESEVPQQLQLEKQMDLYNNGVGLDYCSACNSSNSNSEIKNGIMTLLNNGSLLYLNPLDFLASPKWPAGLDGITNSTSLKWTNQ